MIRLGGIGKRVLDPPVALLRRRLAGRWWVHETSRSAEPMPDLPDHPGHQTFADGVGDVVQRRYAIDLQVDEDVTAEGVISWFRGAPDAQAPTTYATFSEPITEVGQQLSVHLAGPWDGPIEVLAMTPTTLVLGTRDGHMEAGWIAFHAEDVEPGVVRFSVVSAARAGDRAFWLLHVVARIGQWVQADMWSSLLEAAARHVGDHTPPKVRIRTITHRQDPDAGGRTTGDAIASGIDE